jgi:hypothetical protein
MNKFNWYSHILLRLSISHTELTRVLLMCLKNSSQMFIYHHNKPDSQTEIWRDWYICVSRNKNI